MTDENKPDVNETPIENSGSGEQRTGDQPAVGTSDQAAAATPAPEAPAPDEAAPVARTGEGSPGETVSAGDASEDDAEAAMLKMLNDLPAEESNTRPEDINFGGSDVAKAEFQQLSQPAGAGEPRNIEMLQDVNLPVSIELGRTRMTVSDILSLGPGSVVELNKLAGEPVDVLVNAKPVARGEVVVIDENFGVRVTQLLTAEERLKALGDD